ncbi:hypothetical protein AB1Y20_012092 [Prymnesium parvum]|uniref:Macrophage erythroblast attacher n=1 Tax=Prymnesium parvum TaxID=97485 RepID=A0AB34INE2_PRYPA
MATGLEHELLKLPAERLAQLMRVEHKLVEKQLGASLAALRAAPTAASPHAAVGEVLADLQRLKRKLADVRSREEAQLSVCRSRLSHLHPAPPAAAAAVVPPPCGGGGEAALAHRLVADYLHRRGLHSSAAQLSEASGVAEWVSGAEHEETARLSGAVRRGDAAAALAWCAQHRARLKKGGSNLEAMLRLQQAVAMVEEGQTRQAVAHVREHLLASEDANIPPELLRKTMAALALGRATRCESVAALFDAARWDSLATQFEREHRAASCLSETAPLVAAVGAGLCAMKTPHCAEADGPHRSCPVCASPFRQLASHVPSVQRSRSTLLCRLTGEPMDADNVPLVLPDGQVYSLRAVEALAAREGGTTFRHPLSQEVVPLEQVRKAFIL